jgi:hypothetical protein
MCGQNTELSGAFAELQRETISFVMSVCPSIRPLIRMEQLVSHWTNFHEIWYLSILRKSIKKLSFIKM